MLSLSSQQLAIIVIFFVVVLAFRLWKFRTSPSTEFRDALWRRYTGEDYVPLTVKEERALIDGRLRIDVQNADRLIAHMDRIVDRQINKARGILPFNSVLLAILAYEKDHLTQAASLFLVITLAISSLCCLFMFPVQWSSDAYTSFSKELDAAVKLARSRSIYIECAIWTSVVALIAMIVTVGHGNN